MTIPEPTVEPAVAAVDPENAIAGRVHRANEEVEAARIERDAYIRAARADGVSLRRIADALGMSHQAVQNVCIGHPRDRPRPVKAPAKRKRATPKPVAVPAPVVTEGEPDAPGITDPAPADASV